jgi:DNA-binding NarL/FixJ family response regulator
MPLPPAKQIAKWLRLKCIRMNPLLLESVRGLVFLSVAAAFFHGRLAAYRILPIGITGSKEWIIFHGPRNMSGACVPQAKGPQKSNCDAHGADPFQNSDKKREGTMKNLRILIADDHDLMRRGLRALVESHPGWQVCDEAHTGREAVAIAEQTKPDVVILDISMPELNGLEAARNIRKASPNTEILILSIHYSDQLIREILGAGVRGYIMKSDSDRDLINALENLANHRPFFTPKAAEVMLAKFNHSGSRATMGEMIGDRLTAREREIVQLLSEGKSSKDVASLLGISVKTAETHRANVMRKLEIHSVSELVRYAVRNQIIEA